METSSLLLRRAQKGDSAAFEQLIAPYERMIFQLCVHTLGQADGPDAAQEAMLAIYLALPSYEGRSSLKTWCYRIAHNKCLDQLRKAKRQPASSLDELTDAGWNPGDGKPGPYAQLESKERRARLTQAIAALPEDMRLAVTLCLLQCLSYEEAADIMGVQLGTVKSRLNRARKKLLDILSDDRELFASAAVKERERRRSHDL